MVIPRVVLIIGLPGSGKTHLALNEYVPQGYTLIDDPKDLNEVKELLALGKRLVITDPHLCNPQNRNNAIKFFVKNDCVIELIFFEKDKEACLTNIIRRNDGRIIYNLDVFQYEIPSGFPTRKVYIDDIHSSEER